MSSPMRLKIVLLAGIFAVLFAIRAWSAGYTDIYIIGDSLSDQGNLFHATQQMTGNGIPANDQYYKGRFANGENYAGVLAERFGISLIPSSKGGNNFAFGGARVDYNVVEADATKPFPVSLLRQGGVFPEDAFPWTTNGQRAALAARNVKNADGFYIVFTGSNDMADLINMVAIRAANPNFPAVDPAAVIANVLSGIDAAIATAVASGARDVVVPNAPNFGLVPRIMRSGPALATLASGLGQQYNAALEVMIAKWAGRVNIIPLDVYGMLTEIVANPAAFGFTNVSTACYTGFVSPGGPSDTVCSTPDTYAFWDNEHPTAALHAVLAERMHGAAILDILADLDARLNAITAASGVVTALAAKLVGVRQKLSDENLVNDGATVAKLKAFKMAVDIQRSKGRLTEPQAEVLNERADKLVFLISALR